MAKFVFELEGLLRARAAEERKRQLVVGAFERERARIEDLIRECQSAIVRGRDDLREALGGARAGSAVDLAGVRMQAGAGLHMVARAQRHVFELAGVHRKLDAARLELLKAATARKAVEMLKERRFEEWREEQKRLEAAAMDELAVMRAGKGEELA
ncbi:MAG: hypothetical protein GC200_09285 [Tepidisphaera sp.]|nr:hypothetical protein [Tepidisphaera sp.]